MTGRVRRQRENRETIERLNRDALEIARRFALRYRCIEAERANVKRRYGICYSDGTIRIRLRHATSGELLKYSSLVNTLCHELAHLRHFDHSPRFHRFYRELLAWAKRAQIYRPARTALVAPVVGARIDGSRAFELLIRPSARPPTDAHLHHMGLERSDLEAGVSLAEAREQFAELAGPGPFGAWTRSSLDWSAPLLPQEAGRSVLKTSYCNLQNDGSRRLEAVVRTRNLVAPKVDCRGRAAVRLANALAVARWIGNHAAGSSPCS